MTDKFAICFVAGVVLFLVAAAGVSHAIATSLVGGS